MPKVKLNTTTENTIDNESINTMLLMDDSMVSEIIKNLSFDDKARLWRYLYEKNAIKGQKIKFHVRINQINNNLFLSSIFLEYKNADQTWGNKRQY